MLMFTSAHNDNWTENKKHSKSKQPPTQQCSLVIQGLNELAEALPENSIFIFIILMRDWQAVVASNFNGLALYVGAYVFQKIAYINREAVDLNINFTGTSTFLNTY